MSLNIFDGRTAYFARFDRCLLPTGAACFACCQMFSSIKHRFRLLSGRFEHEESGIMDASHFRWFTFDSAARLIEQAGFKFLAHFGDGNAPLPMIRRLWPESVSKAIDRAVSNPMPGMFASQALMVATPGPSAQDPSS